MMYKLEFQHLLKARFMPGLFGPGGPSGCQASGFL
jgi:hypothetical protein